MDLVLDYFTADLDAITEKEAVCDISLLETENQKEISQKLLVPMCSCEYIKRVAARENIKCPDFGNDLKPTQIDDNDQCQFCGYFACWKKIDIFFYESSAIPYWSQRSWYRKSIS